MSNADNKPLNVPKTLMKLPEGGPPRFDLIRGGFNGTDDLIVAIGEGLAILLNALGEDPDNDVYGPAMLRAADRLVLLTARGSS